MYGAQICPVMATRASVPCTTWLTACPLPDAPLNSLALASQSDWSAGMKYEHTAFPLLERTAWMNPFTVAVGELLDPPPTATTITTITTTTAIAPPRIVSIFLFG